MEVQLEIALRLHVLVSFSVTQPCAKRGGSSAEDFPKRLFGLGKMVELAQSLPRSPRSMWRRAWLLGNFRLPPKVADSKLQGGEPKRSAGETVRGTKAAYANPRFTIIASGVGMRPRKAV